MNKPKSSSHFQVSVGNFSARNYRGRRVYGSAAARSFGGATAPSSKLNIAGIGFGGQGGHDLAQMKARTSLRFASGQKSRPRTIFKKYPKQNSSRLSQDARRDEGSMRW